LNYDIYIYIERERERERERDSMVLPVYFLSKGKQTNRRVSERLMHTSVPMHVILPQRSRQQTYRKEHGGPTVPVLKKVPLQLDIWGRGGTTPSIIELRTI